MSIKYNRLLRRLGAKKIMASKFNVTIVDNSSEPTTFGVPVDDINAGNAATLVPALDDLVTAVTNLTLGAVSQDSITLGVRQYVYVLPTNPYANREAAVTFTLAGVSEPSNKIRVSLGAPDLALFPFVAAQSDILNIPFGTLGAELTAMIAWLELYVKHPITGEAMTVTRMEKIGRNL